VARVSTNLKLTQIRRGAEEAVRQREERLRAALEERERADEALRMANALLADKAAHLETLVRQRTAKLRETVAELEAFSYSIAHDMRAPLRSLRGFSEILLGEHVEKLDEEGRRLLGLIGASARRMDKLVLDVLNYGGVLRVELPMEPVDVGQLLRGIVDTYPKLSPREADVALEEPFPRVIGNEAMLMQIFSNLMGNAVKFVRPGVKPRLKVWSEDRGEFARIFVQDNGIGIEPDQHEKIFGIFQRVDKRYEGTGIGLAIVKKAVERMGGGVGVESQPGKGSVFWIEARRAP
jgi:signal transduction histidine kinase